MNKDILKILVNEQELDKLTTRLAEEIDRDFGGKCEHLVLLGILVSLVTKSGASRAYGEWAVKTIKSRRGASFQRPFSASSSLSTTISTV